VPSDTGFEVVNESLICVKNGQYQTIDIRDGQVSQNLRSHGNAKSLLHSRSKSVPSPLLGLLEDTCRNATVMSNYTRRKFTIRTSSMNLVQKENDFTPRSMSEFAAAQLEKKKWQGNPATEKVEPVRRTKTPDKAAGKSMFDEIKGLMKKAHNQSVEAQKKIVNVTVPSAAT
jgi:hypothetical protein